VRLYYSNRIFMGFCCVCCEVLYLALFLLHVPAYNSWAVIDVQVCMGTATAGGGVITHTIREGGA
jgi:hypothetical protein